MKKLKITMVFLFITMLANGQYKGIQFESNLNWIQIKEKAKKENKYIFIDVFATWCSPCKMMAEKTFTQEELGDYINRNFIPVKVQMDKTKQDNEKIRSWYTDAKTIEVKYHVTAYPTILLLDPSGLLVDKVIGYKESNDLLLRAKQAVANSIEFGFLYRKYSNGNRDSSLMKGLAKLAIKTGQNEIAAKVAKQYVNGLSEHEMLKKDNLIFISQFISSSNDTGFKLFRKYSKKINTILGDNMVEEKIRNIIGNEEIAPHLGNERVEPDWLKIDRVIKAKYGAIGAEKINGAQMIWYANKKDWLNFGKYYALYYKTAIARSEYHINNMSWSVFEFVNNPEVLNVAINAQKYSMDNFAKDDPEDIDTYANLLYKAGKLSDALEWQEKATKLAPENNDFANNLEKMRAGIPTWAVEESKK